MVMPLRLTPAKRAAICELPTTRASVVLTLDPSPSDPSVASLLPEAR
jgi:hypothetical protein